MRPWRWLRRSIRLLDPIRLVLPLLAVILMLPTMFILIINYNNMKQQLEDEIANTIFLALKQVDINISNKLSSIKDISDSLLVNPILTQAISNQAIGKSLSEQIADFRQLELLIQQAQSNKDISKVRLFINKEIYFAQENLTFFPFETAEQLPWFDQIVRRNGQVYYSRAYHHRYHFEFSDIIISQARVIKDLDDLDQAVGVLMLDIQEASLSESITELGFVRQESIFIADQQGRIISCTDKTMLDRIVFSDAVLAHLAKDKMGVNVVENGSEKSYVIHRTIEATGWIIVAMIPTHDILQEYRSFDVVLSFVMLATFVIILSLLAFFLTSVIVNRLRVRINRLDRIIEIADIDRIRPLDESGRGISKLENSIISLLASMKALTEESYSAKLKQKEAQLSALQAQINPHFLYNTLDTINWMAIRQQAPEISSLVDSLAKYFRLSLSKGKDLVTIQQELELIKVYMVIQRARFESLYQLDIHCDEDAANHLVPKLTLQPIIENALEHGLQKKTDGEGAIVINVHREDPYVQIEVVDNGAGFQIDPAVDLVNSPSGKGQSGYGLYNVHQRIILFSDNDSRCGIHVSSTKGVGTKVTITLRAKKTSATE